MLLLENKGGGKSETSNKINIFNIDDNNPIGLIVCRMNDSSEYELDNKIYNIEEIFGKNCDELLELNVVCTSGEGGRPNILFFVYDKLNNEGRAFSVLDINTYSDYDFENETPIPLKIYKLSTNEASTHVYDNYTNEFYVKTIQINNKNYKIIDIRNVLANIEYDTYNQNN